MQTKHRKEENKNKSVEKLGRSSKYLAIIACCPYADEIMSLLHDLRAAIYLKNVYFYADSRGQVASYVFFHEKMRFNYTLCSRCLILCLCSSV